MYRGTGDRRRKNLVDVVVMESGKDHIPTRPRSLRDGAMKMDLGTGYVHTCDVVCGMSGTHALSHICHCGAEWSQDEPPKSLRPQES